MKKGNIRCIGFISYLEKIVEEHKTQMIWEQKSLEEKTAHHNKDLAILDRQIKKLQAEGRPRPSDVFLELAYPNPNDDNRICDYCGTVIRESSKLSRYFVYRTDDKLDLCPCCAYRYCPYLTCALVPFLKRNMSLFLALQKRFPQELFDLRESRVPQTMAFIRRVCDMRLFL